MKLTVKQTLIATCLAAGVLVAGCSDSDDDNAQNTLPANDAPSSVLDEAALAQLEGVWEQRGYGDVYAFDGNRTTWYSITENTCLEIDSFAGLAGIGPAELEQARYELRSEVSRHKAASLSLMSGWKRSCNGFSR